MSRYFLLFGPPGAGKGTQSRIMSSEYNLSQVASGDLFRDNLKRQTPLGEMARQYIERGELVPDDVTVSMIRDRLKQPDAAPGALLDGFPRTLAQAHALDGLLAEFGGRVNCVLFMKVREHILLERLSSRWVCRGPQQHVYNVITNPPKTAGVCDIDGAELYQRDDDKAEVQGKRIRIFFDQTAPLIEFYRARGVLAEIEGEQPMAAVTAQIRAAVTATVHA